MAQVFTVNVYEIDGAAVKTVRAFGIPSAQAMFRPYVQGSDGSNTSLYGIIEMPAFGPATKKFGVIQTVSALVTLANA